MLQFLPSEIAASAVLLARRLSHRDRTGRLSVGPASKPVAGWTATLEHFTGHKEADLMRCARELNVLMARAQTEETLQAVCSKYKSKVRAPHLMRLASRSFSVLAPAFFLLQALLLTLHKWVRGKKHAESGLVSRRPRCARGQHCTEASTAPPSSTHACPRPRRAGSPSALCAAR